MGRIQPGESTTRSSSASPATPSTNGSRTICELVPAGDEDVVLAHVDVLGPPDDGVALHHQHGLGARDVEHRDRVVAAVREVDVPPVGRELQVARVVALVAGARRPGPGGADAAGRTVAAMSCAVPTSRIETGELDTATVREVLVRHADGIRDALGPDVPRLDEESTR